MNFTDIRHRIADILDDAAASIVEELGELDSGLNIDEVKGEIDNLIYEINSALEYEADQLTSQLNSLEDSLYSLRKRLS